MMEIVGYTFNGTWTRLSTYPPRLLPGAWRLHCLHAMTFLSSLCIRFRLPWSRGLEHSRWGLRWPNLLGAVLVTLTASASELPAIRYSERPEVKAFIQNLVATDHFDAPTLSKLFEGVSYNAEAVGLVTTVKGPVVRSWRAYRSRVVEPHRIQAGVAFWRKHAVTLERAEKEFGVPAEVIVGILGVETIYARNMGRFPVLEVLTTLAFD